MSPGWVWIIAGTALIVLLWVAYKIGQILIRILVGLAALGLISWGIWHFLK
ncbi:MAG TPA: hypothetical protein VJ570_00565 [Holophagaceae bacterium]|nr:hypothetical protein [Holophagaceae bacterium]